LIATGLKPLERGDVGSMAVPSDGIPAAVAGHGASQAEATLPVPPASEAIDLDVPSFARRRKEPTGRG
jgi:hypothetical protein